MSITFQHTCRGNVSRIPIHQYHGPDEEAPLPPLLSQPSIASPDKALPHFHRYAKVDHVDEFYCAVEVEPAVVMLVSFDYSKIYRSSGLQSTPIPRPHFETIHISMIPATKLQLLSTKYLS